MKTKKLISTIFIAITAILMVTAVLSSVQAVDAAPKKVKVTWNANGGKIGKINTKITPVKKNAKVGKLLKTPIRNGYEFKGWYTKKSGGKKISSATKVKNKVTYYAQWKKKTVTTKDKIVGHWSMKLYGYYGHEWYDYYFFADGHFQYFYFDGLVPEKFEGKYSVSNGKVYFKDVKMYKCSNTIGQLESSNFGFDYKKYSYYPPVKRGDTISEYKFDSDKANYLYIVTIDHSEGVYTIGSADKFIKVS